MWAADGAAHAGAARRRRERRLRAYLRYARMSVAMALAEATHHTAPRGQKTARARGEERDELYDAKGLMTPPSSWPTPLVEVRPQGRVLRHAVEGLGEFAPWCKSSMLLCRRWWTTWQKPYGYWIDRLLSRLSKCPQSLALRVHRVLLFQRNSWWKCRPFLLPRASPCGSRSRSLSFHPLPVQSLAVFKVFLQNRVRRSALLRRSLTFLFLVLEVLLVLSPNRVRRSGLLRRSLTFQFLVVEVPAVFLVLRTENPSSTCCSGSHF